ncbi:MAG: hypothetical protein R3F54_06150 [Alphaproteobacteria bacterium]
MTFSNDRILVAPARSGSTWLCMLLNELDNVVALDEPFAREALAEMDPAGFAEFVGKTLEDERRMILESAKAHSTKAIGDRGLGNHYGEVSHKTGLRARQVEFGTIDISKTLSPDFTLVIKHTIPFTGIIDRLILRYPTYVLVRNPLAILISWNSIEAAYRDGRIQDYALNLTGDLAERLDVPDRFERQLRLLEWHFENYLSVSPQHVVRYEDLTTSRADHLHVITGQHRVDGTAGKAAGSRDDVDHLFHMLVARGDSSPIFAFYDRDAIEAMHASMTRRMELAIGA